MKTGDGAESTAKMAHVDEVDLLVRRRNELVLEVTNARAVGKRLAERLGQDVEEVSKRLKRDAKEEAERLKRWAKAEGETMVREAEERAVLVFAQNLSTVCAELQAENEERFGGMRLPPEMWQKILDEHLDQNDLLAFAMTCRFFRDTTKGLGKKLESNLKARRLLELRKSGKMASHSLDWFQWICDTLNVMPGFKWGSKRAKGAVYEGNLVNYAAFRGSIEILRWLVEEKGWELNRHTGWYAGQGGSVEILEYLEFMGYKFTRAACDGAARGGQLEALKFLKGLDPPCPWGAMGCTWAAEGGHLDVLKWARSQDPPCPWSEDTCASAALRGNLEVLKWLRAQDPPCPWNEQTCYWAAHRGHLDVLEWARSQDPPCPWSRSNCKEAASEHGHANILNWIDEQQDESDAEPEPLYSPPHEAYY